jgi:ABC-type multidrug transport system fused ATPase/permease subunit
MSLKKSPIISKIRNTAFWQCVKLLEKRDLRIFSLVLMAQIFLGFLDLIGIALVGILGSLAINGIQEKSAGNRVSKVVEIVGLQNETFQEQVAIVGALAALLLILRTLFSVIISRRVIFYLSRKGAEISATMTAKLLDQSITFVQKRTSQETVFALTSGVNSITVGVLSNTVNMISDSIIMLILSLGLFLISPVMAIMTFTMFATVATFMYLLLHKRVKSLGLSEARQIVQSNELIYEVLNNYRESIVKNRRAYYSDRFAKLRINLARNLAEVSFLPNISKYVIESAVIIGALVISATQFIIADASRAVTVLALFMAAGSRIAPAVLRIQQGAIAIRSSLAIAESTLQLNSELNEMVPKKIFSPSENEQSLKDFEPKIEAIDVHFSYPQNDAFSIKGVTCSIYPGEVVALVGGSGSGKTTFSDLLLGILEPTSGAITISGMKPQLATQIWSKEIAYVSQNVSIINGTVRENLEIGFDKYTYNESELWRALELSQLDRFVKQLYLGLDSEVGEYGSSLSGGQRQRLGIARALVSNPTLLILDEATSSLDGKTESELSEAIQSLKGRVTTVIIAHRLSTIRDADKILYFENGKVAKSGTFTDLRNSIPDFDEQARLMGL